MVCSSEEWFPTLGPDPKESDGCSAESCEHFVHFRGKGTHLGYTEGLDILGGL